MYNYIPKRFINPQRACTARDTVRLALIMPPWLTSESEDDEPPMHKLEVDACVMAMENVYLQRSKRVPYACGEVITRTNSKKYAHAE